MATEISDWNDLDNVANDLTGDYVLVNDLDSGTDGYAGIGDDFEPIGEQAFDGEFYEGIFDGDGFEIRDLIVDTTDRNVGLFSGIRSPGEIKNLSVVGDITTTSDSFNASVLCSENRGLIENCTAGGSVTALSIENTGGLVARNEDTVTESYATGSVEGNEVVGGLVGQNGGTVTESYATGSVEGDDRVGGLVGQNSDTVTESYATGSVEGDTDVGGLVGQNGGTVTESYWDTETTGQSTSDGGTGLTTAEMQGSEAETNMDGFDFANVWDSVLESDGDATADGYPILLSVDRENQLDAQGILSLFDLSVQTNAATDIGNFSATLNGELVDLDAEATDADVFFEFGETVGQNQTPTQTLTEPATFDELIDELDANTEYEFRAVAEAQDEENETFTDEGDILTFTTDEFLLSVTTNAATDVGEFTATLNGELTELDSEADDADVFFNYGESLTTNQTTAQTLTDPQAFDELLETLEPNTTFEFQAVAESEPREGDVFTDEGDILSFDTDIVTLDGTITLDETAAENADVIVHNLTQDTFEGRLSTDTDGDYSVDLPDANREDTVAVAVDFADGLERYGRLITTVLE